MDTDDRKSINNMPLVKFIPIPIVDRVIVSGDYIKALEELQLYYGNIAIRLPENQEMLDLNQMDAPGFYVVASPVVLSGLEAAVPYVYIKLE